jgi:hypothetical protein
MAGKVLNIKVYSPIKLHSGLTGKCHAICHYIQFNVVATGSRPVILHKNIINVGYNVQAASDPKHKLLAGYGTGGVNDTHALGPMAVQTKGLLGVECMNVLADKGYHTGEGSKICQENDIATFVPPKAPATKDTGLYPTSGFVYCPAKGQYYSMP